jgi:endonuclease YncB( thermonuclease family)
MTMRVLTIALWFAIAALTQPAGPVRADILKGTASVIDGDTVEIHGQTVRFLDIDAPETKQHCRDAAGADYPCGQHAAQALSAFLQQREIVCDWSNLDREGRRLARCILGGRDIGLWAVEQGWAVPDRDCKCETYRPAAEQAKDRKLGLWAGTFEMPWVWRQRMP